jgi:transposase
VPGIGVQSAALLLAELPELDQATKGQIAAMAGVAPFNHDSGPWRGTRRIRGGRGQVRHRLWMATIAAGRHYEPLRTFYQRLRAKGKPAKVALIAAIAVDTINATKVAKMRIRDQEGARPEARPVTPRAKPARRSSFRRRKMIAGGLPPL